MIERQQADKWMEELHLDGMQETVLRLCQDRNLSLDEFYKQNRAFMEEAPVIQNQFVVEKRSAQATPLEVQKRIVELSDREPLIGCGLIEQRLNLEGKFCSKPTIQKILEWNGRGTRYDRLMLLEARYMERKVEITPKQTAILEKANPCFRERKAESHKPGEVLCQDIIPVRGVEGLGELYLHTVVDTYCSYAFGYLASQKTSNHAVRLLQERVLPFYRDMSLEVCAILTSGHRFYTEKGDNPYSKYLGQSGIQHVHERRVPHRNGFSEKFQNAVKDEFFATIPRTALYRSTAELQKDLDTWLQHYNFGRPNRGYRNMGQKPYESIFEYLAHRSAESNGNTRR